MSFEAFDSDSSSDSSDSEASETDTDESDFEELHILPVNCIRADVPRAENFFEGIVPRMDDFTFISHFRLNRRLVNDVENMVYFKNDIFCILLSCFI